MTSYADWPASICETNVKTILWLVTPDPQAGYWGYCAMGTSAVVALLPKEPPFMDSALSVARDARSFPVPQVDHAQSNVMLGDGFH
jgi:hypothetical protein